MTFYNPKLGRQRQENPEFKASVGHLRSSPKRQIKLDTRHCAKPYQQSKQKTHALPRGAEEGGV